MFGSNDQNQNPDSQTVPDASVPAMGNTAAVGAVVPTSASPADTPTENINVPDVVASAPSAPTIPDPMVTPSTQVEAGINGVPMQSAYTELAAQVGPARPSQPGNVPTAVDPDLAQIKQQALQSLEPLVGQLDQAPDEKFKTVMMLIQASDNSKMLTEAYAAASQITDEKARAQALLDVVNEINYFTAQAQNNK